MSLTRMNEDGYNVVRKEGDMPTATPERTTTSVAAREKGRDVAAGETWITVRIPKEAKERLDAWAQRYDHGTSWIVRRLVLRALDERLDEKDEMP